MIKDENYIQISGWMINELNLKGNELLIYAIIHGFSQDGKSVFSGSLSYIAEWTNSTKQGVIKSLKSLEEKKLIVKVIRQKDAATRLCEYFTAKSREKKTVPPGEKAPEARQGTSTTQDNSGKLSLPPDHATQFTTIQNRSSKQSLPPHATEFTTPGKLSLPNKNSEILVNSTPPSSEEKNKTLNGSKETEAEEACSKQAIQTICRLFNTPSMPLSDDFVPAFIRLCRDMSLPFENIDEYLSWYYGECVSKNPKNLLAYFYKTATQNYNAARFFASKKQQRQEQAQTEAHNIVCPVCNTRHIRFESCPCCGLINHTDTAEIKECVAIYSLPEKDRLRYKQELEALMRSTGSDIAAYNKKKRELFEKYTS